MKNRAKCALCKTIIESFHATDYVVCSCGEISVDGGPSMRCAAKDWANFYRVDDLGNDIKVTVKKAQSDEITESMQPIRMSRENLISQLKFQMDSIEKLPQNALDSYVTQYDLYSIIALVWAIFNCDLKKDI